MTITDLFTVLGAASLVIIAAAMVPTLYQTRRTLRKAETVLDTLEQEMAPLCKTLNTAASELEILTVSLNDKLERSDKILDTLQESAEVVYGATTLLKKAVRPAVINIGGIAAGIRVFSSLLINPRK